MPKLHEKYESKDAALEAFEAMLVDAEGEEGGVTLHDDVIKQFKVVKDTTGNLSAARKAEREAKAALKKYEEAVADHDIEDIDAAFEELIELRSQKESFEGDGDVKEKIEEAVSKRLELAQAKHDREKAKLEKERDTALESATGFKSKLSSVTLEGELRKTGEKLGVKPHAMKRVVKFGGDEFQIDDEGSVVDKTDAGRSIEDWLESEIAEDPTYTIELKNGSMGANNEGGGAGKRTVKRSEFDRASPADRESIMAKVRNGEATLAD